MGHVRGMRSSAPLSCEGDGGMGRREPLGMWLCTHCACMTVGTHWMYLDLAAATHRGCSSEITPFPMGVGRNGNLHLSTNS